jgi:hypothetical protein
MRRDRLIVFSASTEMDKVSVDVKDEGYVTLLLPKIRLLAGEYVLMCGVMDKNGFHRFHQLPTTENLTIEVAKEKDLGVMLHDHDWKVEKLPVAPGNTERPV